MSSQQVYVYTSGIVHCSACAPANMPAEDVAQAVNAQNPTGTASSWELSSDPTFRTGQPNPCECDEDPNRKHYLLEC